MFSFVFFVWCLEQLSSEVPVAPQGSPGDLVLWPWAAQVFLWSEKALEWLGLGLSSLGGLPVLCLCQQGCGQSRGPSPWDGPQLVLRLCLQAASVFILERLKTSPETLLSRCPFLTPL